MHWSDRYIGEPYVAGQHDCAAFAERVAREQFDLEVTLPAERGPGLRSQSAQIDALRGEHAEAVASPADGDAVLMRARGQLSHIGIYCQIGAEGWVVHAMRNAGAVVRHRLRDLPAHGLVVEGFYRWRPA